MPAGSALPAQTGDLAIEYRAIAKLIPYARNARTHSEAQVALIAGSIREYGFTNPILVDGDNGIIAGHGRVLAARTLGMATVPVIELAHLSDSQRRAYILADNRLAEQAGWDQAMLALELGDLQLEGFDLSLTGFEDDELDRLLRSHDGTGARDDEDDIPETPENPVSRPGDLWHLGPHRLLCGDSTVATDVESVLGGVTPLLMVTDPPYGVEYDPAWRNKAGVAGTRRTGKVLNDDRADWREAWALFPGDVAYVWHGALHAATVAESLEVAGFAIRSQVIWAKERLVLSRGDYHWQHEPCWYAVRHGTQKPVECMRRPILNNSCPAQAVYDPFLGSGTTLIAAETTGRTCFGIELHPAYVDVAVERWQRFTGQSAVLQATGQSYGDVHAERAAPAEVFDTQKKVSRA
jgi:DNA modification methylase